MKWTTKGAIRAGIDLLMKEANINTGDVQEVLLSGMFGNYINPEKAVMLGLIPPFSLERIHFIGNGAMDGALRALLNLEERSRADEIAARVHHVELSGRADFEETFLRYLELGAWVVAQDIPGILSEVMCQILWQNLMGGILNKSS